MNFLVMEFWKLIFFSLQEVAWHWYLQLTWKWEMFQVLITIVRFDGFCRITMGVSHIWIAEAWDRNDPGHLDLKATDL